MRDAEAQARIDLAAVFRAAVLHDLHEGIDNHCSLAVPGEPGRFLLNPYGPHWSELCASDLLVVDRAGRTEGDGEAETTAFALHAHLHAARPDAACVLHTHMPHATALAATEEGLDTRLSQNGAKFHDRWAFHRDYGGRLVDADACAAIADSVRDGIRVILLASHGVLVVGESVAHAWWDLYFFERAARVQVLAAATGQPLRRMTEETAKLAGEQFEEERADAPRTWAAVRRLVDRHLPGYEG